MNCIRCQTPIPANSAVCAVCGTPAPDVTVLGGTATVESGLLEMLQAAVGAEYTIERELGRGGMGAVFLATEPGLQRNVAIKVLPPFLTLMVPTATQRFMREAQTAATLDHPNIIPIYRVSQGSHFAWYVMKYVVGESLDHVLAREGQLPLASVVEIVAQAADALDYAHSRGIVHRDIKPGNVIVDPRGGVTLTDFGIARRVADADPITLSGAAMGTPLYISPEQCAEKPVTAAADQYALGVMTFQMLAGRAPFSGSLAEIVKQHVLDPVPSLVQRRPDLPPEVGAAVERALAKRPEDRFPTVGAFAQALGAGAREAGAAGALVRVSSRSGAWVDAPTLPLRPVTLQPGRIVRRAALYGTLSVAVAATAWVFAQDRSPPPVPPAAAHSSVVAATPSIPPPIAARGASKAPIGEGLSGAPAPESVPPKPAAGLAPPAAPPTWGRISVTTNPPSVVTINGRHVPYPVYRHRVPPGDVRLRFLVTDSAGSFTHDTIIILKPGEEKRVGTVALRRP